MVYWNVEVTVVLFLTQYTRNKKNIYFLFSSSFV